jgi:hypothetical protein
VHSHFVWEHENTFFCLDILLLLTLEDRPTSSLLIERYIKPVQLTESDLQFMLNCTKREYLFSFQSAQKPTREQMVALDEQGDDMHVRIYGDGTYYVDTHFPAFDGVRPMVIALKGF